MEKVAFGLVKKTQKIEPPHLDDKADGRGGVIVVVEVGSDQAVLGPVAYDAQLPRPLALELKR